MAQRIDAIDRVAVRAARGRMLSERAEARARRLLGGVCDPTRMKIIRALRGGPLAASDIARVIGRSRAATSQHLKVLRELTAVEGTRRGNQVRYELSPTVNAAVLGGICEQFDRLEGAAAAD